MNLVQSLLNPPDAAKPVAPQRTNLPPITEQQIGQKTNEAIGGQNAAFAAQSNALRNSYGQRYGMTGKGLQNALSKMAIQNAQANMAHRVNVPMQGMQMLSNYQNTYDNGLQDDYRTQMQLALQQQQLGVSALNPLLGALTSFAG